MAREKDLGHDFNGGRRGQMRAHIDRDLSEHENEFGDEGIDGSTRAPKRRKQVQALPGTDRIRQTFGVEVAAAQPRWDIFAGKDAPVPARKPDRYTAK